MNETRRSNGQSGLRTLRMTVQHFGIRSTDAVDAFVEERILALQPRLQIDEAHVRLACHFEESPAFSVHVHLVTPGPDVVAEGRDHSIRAAIVKVLAELETQIQHRAGKQKRRRRSHRQSPTSGRADGAPR